MRKHAEGKDNSSAYFLNRMSILGTLVFSQQLIFKLVLPNIFTNPMLIILFLGMINEGKKTCFT
jgi:hypothetical protein